MQCNREPPASRTVKRRAAPLPSRFSFTLGCLLAAAPLERLLGMNGMRVATQIMGLILTAIGVEMIFGGIADHFGWVPGPAS